MSQTESQSFFRIWIEALDIELVGSDTDEEERLILEVKLRRVEMFSEPSLSPKISFFPCPPIRYPTELHTSPPCFHEGMAWYFSYGVTIKSQFDEPHTGQHDDERHEADYSEIIHSFHTLALYFSSASPLY